MADHDDRARLEMISTRWTLLNRAHQKTDDEGQDDAVARAQAQSPGPVRRFGARTCSARSGTRKRPTICFRSLPIASCTATSAAPIRTRAGFATTSKGSYLIWWPTSTDAGKDNPRGCRKTSPNPRPPRPRWISCFRKAGASELLARTWLALDKMDQDTGQSFHAVLHYRADHPKLRSPELAVGLTEKLGKPITAVGVRQLVHRARERFAELLRAEVQASLDSDDPDDLQAELQELGLLVYLGNG